MFITGMNPFLGSIFMFLTLIIAIPSAVKAFNYITTLWKGNLVFTPAMLFSIGLVSFFISGGLTGLFLGYFYTGRPLRLVARRGLGELAIFLAFGPMLTLGTGYAISVETITLYSPEFYMLLSLGVPFGLLTTNILFINQFPDAESDAQTGKNHLVVTLGKKASRWGYLLILSLAFSA